MATESFAARGRLLSRVAGLCALAFVASAVLGLTGVLGSDLFFAGPTTRQILAWASQQGGLISLNAYLGGLEDTVFYGLFIVILVHLTGARGVLPTMALIGAVITIVISWTQTGMIYAMVDLAHQGGDTAGVVTLFKLGETMQWADGLGVALALGCTSWLAMRAGALPAVVGWFGVAVGIEHTVEGVLQSQGVGFVGPLGVVLGLLWLLIVGVILLVKPATLRQPPTEALAAPA
jgi:hypothetical protein